MAKESDWAANPWAFLPSREELDRWGEQHEPTADAPDPRDILAPPAELIKHATEHKAVSPARPSADNEGSPGYCACCGKFLWLTRVQIPALHWYADVCNDCAALGEKELAWRLGGLTEDGKFGYELPPDPDALRVPPKPSWRRRGRNLRLAESLTMGEVSRGTVAGFGPSRLTFLRRLRVAWWRMRG